MFFTGSDILASMSPSIINTSDSALNRFSPADRDCYTDEEFLLPNLLWEGGFRYSVKNCLYESVIQHIITNCSCFPAFVEYNIKNIPYCSGTKLKCALRWLNKMGSHVDPDLTVAKNKANETLKCLQRCDLQTETVMTTSSIFPNKETFLYQPEFCLVLQKISKICTHQYQKKAFESRVSWPTLCEEILHMNNTLKVCDALDNANETIANTNQKIIDFLFNYSTQNVAVLSIYFRDPYYTSYSKTEQTSPISFIGNAGGLVSLCLGMSFISLFEVLYHCFDCLFIKLKHYTMQHSKDYAK